MGLGLGKSFTSSGRRVPSGAPGRDTTTMQGWLSILIMIALGAGFALVSVVLSSLLGPRKPTPEKSRRRTSAACRRSATRASGSRSSSTSSR